LIIASTLKPFKGKITLNQVDGADSRKQEVLLSSKFMLLLGVAGLIFVPIFKTITHLPPYVGMMLSLGVVWLASAYIHPEENFTQERKQMYSAHHAPSRIEMSIIQFFLGICVSVASLESLGVLLDLAKYLDQIIPNQDLVIMFLGVASALIDNVPLVAATMGMYTEAMDAKIWHFIAYAAGTGGSMLI